ncbi:MAG: hypothetical protein ACPGQL_01335 [Thermoplasmatota archaeon]
MADAQDDRPDIAKESQFIVEEGLLYRIASRGSIWMNKLFFSCLFLLGIWLLLGASGNVEPGCVDSFRPAENGTADEAFEQCSVWLNTTSQYLGAMAVFSFVASIAFGGLGLIVGKRILERTPTEEEAGAEEAEHRP